MQGPSRLSLVVVPSQPLCKLSLLQSCLRLLMVRQWTCRPRMMCILGLSYRLACLRWPSAIASDVAPLLLHCSAVQSSSIGSHMEVECGCTKLSEIVL